MRLTHWLASALIVGAPLASCGGDGLVLPDEGVAARIEIVSGNGQTATVSATLPDNLVVRVLDSRDRPVAGQRVDFTPAAGSGALVPPSPTTDADGRAVAQWVLGPGIGAQSVTAKPVGNGVPATLMAAFTATATASQAARVIKLAGDGQTAAAGTAVAVPPSVKVFDANDNPVAGVPVAFAVASGGGTALPTTPVSTNADGVAAAASWTLGPVAGSNSLTATVGGTGVSGSPVTFQATGAVGSANRLVFSVQPVNAAVGAPIDPAVRVQIQDAAGNVIPTANGQVTIALGNNPGSATLSGETAVNAQQGTATFSNLRISAPGAGYTLVAHGSGLLDATSTAFNVVNAESQTEITGITPSSTVVGQPYTVSFEVTAAPPSTGTPTGVVTVTDGPGVSCQAPIAVGNCQLVSTTRGTKQIVATYPGDANFAGSASDVENHSVSAAGTTTTINSHQPDPSLIGQQVTVSFSVTVNAPGAGTLDGTVTVSYQNGGGCSAPVSAGQCGFVPTGVGTDRDLTAQYASASGNFGGSSDTEKHTVNPGTTSTSVTSAPNPSNEGQTVQLVATVTVTAGQGSLSGQVRFRDGGSQIGPQVALDNGTAILNRQFAGGSHNLTAEYLGNANFEGSTSDVVVQNVNSAPDADNDSYTTTEDVALNVGAGEGVLAGDSDPDGNLLTAVVQSGPANGEQFNLAADGSFTYTPNPNFNGPDSFTYRASDGSLNSNLATVTITVTAVNDPPQGGEDSYATGPATPLVVDAPGVLANDSDPDSPASALSASLVTPPSNAILFDFNSDGGFSYTPGLGFSGIDSFTYQVSDGSLQSDPVTVMITVSP